MGSVLVATIALAAACGGGGDGAGAGESAIEGPPGTGVDRGAAVYAAKCAECHGANLEGTRRGPSHLSIVYEPGHHNDLSFRQAIKNGAAQHHFRFGPMPPVSGLTDEDITAVIAFIRAEQESRGFQR
jgi:mono/diheme cytochrome c family protein